MSEVEAVRPLTTSLAVVEGGQASDILAWTNEKLSRVSYALLPRVDLCIDRIQSEVRPEIISIGTPGEERLKRIIGDITQSIHKVTPDAPESRYHQEFYEAVLRENSIRPGSPDYPPSDVDSRRLRTFFALRETDAFAKAQLDAIRNLLRANAISGEAGHGFEYNGPLLSVSQIKVGRLSDGTMFIRGVTAQETNYYAYRVIAACSNEVLES